LKALVLGASGQLGVELVRLLGPDSSVPHDQLSITDAAAVDALIAARKPDTVFNCAAYNAVDKAESEPELALLINRDGPANVAVACARHRTKMVHFSTNFVFDGSLDRPYVESDKPRPLSAYGFSKLAGERQVLERNSDALVVRTAAVYGSVGVGFPERILERVRRHGELEMVTDQRVNPTYARDLAERALLLAGEDLNGIVHLVGQGCCSWDEFARAVLDEFDEVAPIRPLTSDQLRARARRPFNGCLGSERVVALKPWRDALHEWAAQVKNP
jgi:dTDP-4-dehydrorhamnose reductase